MNEILKMADGKLAMWILVALIIATTAAAADVKYTKCKLIADDNRDVPRGNAEPEIHIHLTCRNGTEDVVLINERTSVYEIDPQKFDATGTPLTFFDNLADFSTIVRIADYMEAEPFELYDSTFHSLPKLTRGPSSAAPLTIQSSRVKLTNCSFKGNSQGKAGAIYLSQGVDQPLVDPKDGKPVPSVIVEDSWFITGKGHFAGAILSEGYSHVELKSSTFVANTKNAIDHQRGGLFMITDCLFNGKEGPEVSRKRSASVLQGSGPATIRITGSTFKDHFAKVGSVISWTTATGSTGPKMHLETSSFEENSAVLGGVLRTQGSITLDVSECKFAKNPSTSLGGAMQFSLHSSDQFAFTASDTVFTENTAPSGGAIDILVEESHSSSAKTGGGSVRFSNVNFVSNSARNGDGGAVRVHGAADYLTMSINGGLYESNLAGSIGGALKLVQLTGLTVEGARFKSNSLADPGPIGGAIFVGNTDTVVVKGASFEKNQAGKVDCTAAASGDKGGGGLAVINSNVYSSQSSKTVRIVDSTFMENSAEVTGGAIFVDKYDRLEISGLSLLHSKAHSAGALKVDTVQSVSIDGSFVKENEACGWDGGAMFLHKTEAVNVTNSRFHANKASSRGSDAGAIKIQDVSKAIFTHTEFVNNTATGKAGAVYLKGDDIIQVTSSLFSGNKGSFGGALRIVGTGGGNKEKVKIMESVFKNNEAFLKMGGAVDATTVSSVDIGNCEFDSNTAFSDGGSIYLDDAGDITMESCRVAENSAGGTGGGVYVLHGGDVTLAGAIMTGNEAGGKGGGIFLSAVKDLDVLRSIVEKNVAGGAGAGICLEEGGNVNVGSTTISLNRANQGSGVSLDGVKEVRFENSVLQGNEATGEGAAAKITEAESVDVLRTMASEGKSTKGGAFYIDEVAGNVTFTGSAFDGNLAAEDGGALFLKKTGTVKLQDIHKLVSCVAEGNGGGVFLDQAESLTVLRTTVKGGVAKEGGAYFISGVEKVWFEDAVFHGNTAVEHGGAISADPIVSFNCTGCDFQSNKAGGDGGSITLTGTGVVTLNNAKFDDTSAVGNGGALSLIASTSFHVKDVAMRGCRATNGGCFFLESVKELSAHKVDFTGASAVSSGGVVDLQKTNKISLTAWTGKDASAGGSGGAFSMVDVGAVTVENYQVDGSEAGESGGAIFASGIGKFDIKSLHTTNTKAGNGMGGSLALTHLNVTITDSTISSSSAEGNGGCIAVEKSPSFSMTTSGLEECTSVSGDGGALHLPGITEVSIVSSKFSKGSAIGESGRGGGLFVVESDAVKMETVSFESCNAQRGGGCYVRDINALPLEKINIKDCSARQGGGLLAEGIADGGVAISRALVENNVASDVQGGGVSVETSGSVVIEKSTFNTNSAGGSGGGAFVRSQGTFKASDSTFTSNTAKQGGGGALAVKTTNPVIISNVGFDNCVASLGDGGSLELKSAKSVDIRDVSVVGSSDRSANNGGGISLRDVGDVFVDAMNLKSLKSLKDGGGLFVSGATTTTLSNIKVENGAAHSGAGLFLQRAGDVSVTTFTAKHMDSTSDGGALFLEKSGDTFFKGINVIESKADNGGGIFLSDVGRLTGHDLRLSSVEAATDGGAMLIFFAPYVKISDVKVTNSKALNGAGLYLQDVATFDGEALSFDHCTSIERGAGMFVKTTGSVSIVDASFEGGKATTGAGLWMEKVDSEKYSRRLLTQETSVVVDGATFAGNEASEQGGAIFASKLDGAKFANLDVESNSAGGAGGAIYVSDSGYLDVANSTFNGNKAAEGGGSLATNGIHSVEVEGSTFKHSNGNMGGAMLIANADEVILVDGVVSDSKAEQNGGGVMLENVASLEAVDMTFKENRASAGGALDIAGGGNVHMTGVKFEDNQAETWEGSNIQVSSCDSSVQVANSQIGVPLKKAVSTLTSEHSLNEAMHQNPACPGELIQMDGCEYTYKSVGMDSTALVIIAVLGCMGLLMLGMIVAVIKARNPLNGGRQQEGNSWVEESDGSEFGLLDDAPIIPLLARKSLDELEEGVGWMTNRGN